MLKLERVSKTYKVGTFGGSDLDAVREVSFDVDEGHVVSLIGESGSGKTTIGRMILRLASTTRGRITYDGTNIARLPVTTYHRHVQGIFQDPFSSYNPIFKADHVFTMVRQGYFPGVDDETWAGRVENALRGVGLDPGQVLHKYPHQLSGGQLQRILIARALILDIRMLVADEIISMLDASTRIDVLNLLGELQARGLGILFITHDLSLGYYSSDRTVILSRGAIVEMGATEKVYQNPVHPYTRTLLASVPQLHRKWGHDGSPARGIVSAAGACVYHARYPKTEPAGHPLEAVPNLAEVEADHFVGCFSPYVSGAC